MNYRLLRPLLFALPPECAHKLTLDLWKLFSPLLPEVKSSQDKSVSILGLTFPNRIGLAAGLDKNADYIDALGKLGFGFIEVGTVTPKPQQGNAKPRLFRLPENQALINRLGFNNKGVDYLVKRLQQRTYTGVLGVNIGKNRDTSQEQAIDDYRYCLERVYPYADYVTVNISSPNTVGLRDLQHGEVCRKLLMDLKKEQEALSLQHKRYVPLLVKVSPDLDEAAISDFAGMIKDSGMDGVIATNTTVERGGLIDEEDCQQEGGLSGRPLMTSSTAALRILRRALGNDFPIIGVGGVDTHESLATKRAAGADLVQVYTGLIYQGPGLVRELLAP